MARLIFGNSDCTYHELITLFDEPTIAATIITQWTSFARCLGTPLDNIEKFRQDILLRTLTHTDVIEKLLLEWVSRIGEDATLGTLFQNIPDSLKLLKDKLQDKIRAKASCWNDLDADSQKVVMQTNVKFLGRNYPLSSIRDMMNSDKFGEIICKAEMKEFFLKTFKNEGWDLGHYEIPKPLPYYIQRKLAMKRHLNASLFKQTCSDIFLIEGIQHHHLTILARPELTEVSSEQLKKVTRRFILLEHPDDYKEIIQVATYPVHRIKQEDNQFYWQSTFGSCKTIRMFLTNDVEEISETCFVNDHLSTFNNRPIAICSSPGMGKSVLLANLARKMIKAYPERIIIYFELRSFISKPSSKGAKISLETVKHILASIPSFSTIGKEMLLELLHNKDKICEIFLDGFDEISLENLQLAKQLLKCLLVSPNMRVYITSRPHMKTEIENTLGVISLDIAPFNRENQVNYFCDFWTLNQNITNCEKLSQFALTVLESLEFINQNMTSLTKFAGIPLQCSMLAQVYAKHAKMYLNRDNLHFRATNSLYDLYTEFISSNFKNIEECDRLLIKKYHWKEALMLLFPDNHEATQIVQKLTRQIETEDVPWELIFKVGIIEQANDKPNFVHRTFAEYLLAEFIVEEFLNPEAVDTYILVRFIIDSVLDVYKTTRGQIISESDIQVIQKIIESSKSWQTEELNPINLKTVLLSQGDAFLKGVKNYLFQILSKWLFKMESSATIDKLDCALKFLGCSQLVENLHQNGFQENYFLQHEMVCTFVDAALGKCETLLAGKIPRHCDCNGAFFTQDCDKLKWKLLKCTEHGYRFLSQTIIEFYRDASILNEMLNIDSEMGQKLLVCAGHNDNVEFFQYICDTVKSFREVSLQKYFKKFTFQDQRFSRTPLSESINRGNYKLVEYLINFIDDDVKEMGYLGLVCFIGSWRDSPNIIKNKVKILHLLKNLHHNLNIEAIEKTFGNGVNLVLLTTAYDLFEYLPNKRNAKFISMCLPFYHRNDAEMTHLVHWLLSRNLTHLLIHKYGSNFSILDEAIFRNAISPETLALVYMKFSFDLGTLLQSAVSYNDSIVKTIVELSRDVNLVDYGEQTLLHWAAYYRKLDVIHYLLSVGANVNSENRHENTPLHYVFLNRDSSESFNLVHETINLLVKNKSDVLAENIVGLSALQLAKAHQDEMSIEGKTIVLLENSQEPHIKLRVRFINSPFKGISLQVSRSLIDQFEMYNEQVPFTATKCHCFFAWVWNIVQTSGNVNLSDTHSVTLLHFACLFGELKVIKYLLSNGADPHLKDNDGDTPLHYTFDWSCRDQISVLNLLNKKTGWIHECVQLLLKNYANVGVKNKKGKTPLDLAQQQRDNLGIEDRTISLLVERFQLENKID